jgi:septation ring formation regulator EzrA
VRALKILKRKNKKNSEKPSEMNSLFNKLKATVSRDKHRLRTADFDLDMTYITERIIGKTNQIEKSHWCEN